MNKTHSLQTPSQSLLRCGEYPNRPTLLASLTRGQLPSGCDLGNAHSVPTCKLSTFRTSTYKFGEGGVGRTEFGP